MSEEQRKDEETEVEGHGAFPPSTARTTSQATRSRATVPSRPSTAPTMSPRTRSRATSIAAARRSGTNFKGPGSAGPFHLRAFGKREDRGFAARLGKYR